MYALSFWRLLVGASLEFLRVGDSVLPIARRCSPWRRRIGLARMCRRSNVIYARNTCYCLRFKNRRQRDFYALRCGAQLGAQELALADADGLGLLRDRIDGRGRIALRYRAIRRRGDALFATAMRRDDR